MGSGRVEASPERGRPAYASRPAPARPMRKVQIVYYLCRNGQLEHPHFMELAQHPHQPLRLKGADRVYYVPPYLHCVSIPRMMMN
jgi:hypothetical protein